MQAANPASPGLSFQGCFKTLFHKLFPQRFYFPAARSAPLGGYPVGVFFIGTKQGLRPFPFLSAMLPPFDTAVKKNFSAPVSGTRYFSSGIDSLSFGSYAFQCAIFTPLL
jgi:hypothetical protein